MRLGAGSQVEVPLRHGMLVHLAGMLHPLLMLAIAARFLAAEFLALKFGFQESQLTLEREITFSLRHLGAGLVTLGLNVGLRLHTFDLRLALIGFLVQRRFHLQSGHHRVRLLR